MIGRLFFALLHRTPRFYKKQGLAYFVYKRLFGAGRERITVGGASFHATSDDLNEFLVLYHGSQSPEIVACLASRIGEKPAVLWDVGANIGGIAIPLLYRCPALTVVCFEPSPAVCARLIENLKINPAVSARARVVNVALSSEDALLDFWPSNETFNSGVGGMYPARNRDARIKVQVQAARGDSLLGALPAPDVIKVDVEGYEHEVFRGMTQVLAAGPAILFEHEVYRFRERGLPTDTVIKQLQALGYTVGDLNGGERIDLEEDADLLAWRGPESANRKLP